MNRSVQRCAFRVASAQRFEGSGGRARREREWTRPPSRVARRGSRWVDDEAAPGARRRAFADIRARKTRPARCPLLKQLLAP